MKGLSLGFELDASLRSHAERPTRRVLCECGQHDINRSLRPFNRAAAVGADLRVRPRDITGPVVCDRSFDDIRFQKRIERIEILDPRAGATGGCFWQNIRF